MFNSPEFIFSWLGLNKAGVTVAFINTGLKKHALEHCLTQSNAKVVLVSSGLVSTVAEIQGDFKQASFFAWGSAQGWTDMESQLSNVSNARPDKSIRAACTHDSIMAYIYTS